MPWVVARYLAGWLALALLLPSARALAAVRFTSGAITPGSGGSAYLDLTVGPGDARFVVVAVAAPATAVPSSVLMAGQPPAPYGMVVGSTCRIDVYGQIAPATGSNRVSVTVSPRNARFVLAAAAYDGVDQFLPTDDSASQTRGSDALAQGSANLGTGVEGISFAALCATGAMIAAVPDASESSRWNQASGNLLSAGADAISRRMSWQLSAGSALDWAMASFPLRAAPASPIPPDAGVAPVDAPPAADAAASELGSADPAVDGSAPDALADAAPPGRDAPFIAIPDQPDQPDAAAPRIIDLVVTSGCAVAPAASGASALALAALAVLMVLARRRSR